MKVLPYIVLFCVACAAMQAAAKLLFLTYGAILLAGLIFRTREALAFVASCVAMRAFQLHPVACACVMGIAFIVAGMSLWVQSGRS